MKSKPATRRSLKTRRELVDAALQVLEKQGLQELTVRAITEQAEVAHGTFYHHFQSIEEILGAAVETSMVDLAEQLVEKLADSEDRVWVVVDSLVSMFRMLRAHPALGWMLERPTLLARAMRDVVGPYAKRDIQNAVDTGEIDSALVGTAFPLWMWVVIGALSETVANPKHAKTIEKTLVESILRASQIKPARITELMQRIYGQDS